MPGRLRNGNPTGKGGHREGAGRKPEWLKAACQKIIVEKKLVQFLGKVANGEDMEQVVTDAGVSIAVPAAVRERLKATEMLLDRGFGKATQIVGLDEGTKGRLLFVFPQDEK